MAVSLSPLRITAWPVRRLPHPPLQLGGLYRHADGILFVDEEGRDDTRIEQAEGWSSAFWEEARHIWEAGEVYLNLLNLDLGDRGRIVDWASQFGTLGVHDRNYAVFADFPDFVPRVLPTLTRPPSRQQTGPGLALVETLDEFRFGARCLRDATRAWQYLSTPTDGDAPPLAWESLPPGRSWFDDNDLALYAEYGQTPTHAEEVAHALLRIVNPALQVFQPRLLGEERPDCDRQLFTGAPLYSICCLELYNHILERETYRQCANESCNRLFVRQKGRAITDKHRRLGSLYCTAKCARAQAQRQYRRRKQRTTSN